MDQLDPIARLALQLGIILLAAKVGGDLAIRIRQPAVLGELVAGVILGNLVVGPSWLGPMKTDVFLEHIAGIGALILLFEAGLHSTVKGMLQVGWTSLLVAVLGVIAPFALGWGVGVWLLPASSVYVHAFLGATLTATSVGITARVLQDLGRTDSTEARIILGAAVIDDVLGLIVLTLVAGAIRGAASGQGINAGNVALFLGRTVLFLGGTMLLGAFLAPRLLGAARRLRAPYAVLATALVLCFGLSALASAIQLSPIIGAFMAGLVVDRESSGEGDERSLGELVHPIGAFLVPVFFVLMGMRTDLHSFAEPGVLGLAAALTITAVIGKQACALGVWGPGINRLAVGIGMIPRGEVGLIFASVGLALMVGGERIVTPAIYSAIVVMVIATTLMTPSALGWALRRRNLELGT